MSQGSTISWTDSSWNPVRGCDKVSEGCRHCYAKRFAERWRGVPGNAYEHGFDVCLAPHLLVAPLTWTRPQWVFANSMSDLFHDGIPDWYIEIALTVMALADWHVFQVLTKRSKRMANLLSGKFARFASCPNIVWGTSIEDRKSAEVRIPELLRVPASSRFLSAEPLLGDLGTIPLDGIGWVIVGGESGPGARPVDPQWVRSVRDQCVAAAIPFFFKQWGGPKPKLTGKELDGRIWEEKPTFVADPVPDRNERKRRKGLIAAEVAKLFPGYTKGPIPVATMMMLVA